MTQLALSKASFAFEKSILVDMYQKQITVTTIFSSSFNVFEIEDSSFFLIISSSISKVSVLSF